MPDTGAVTFDGQSLLGIKPHEINQAGVSRVFQTPEIFSDLTVFEKGDNDPNSWPVGRGERAKQLLKLDHALGLRFDAAADPKNKTAYAKKSDVSVDVRFLRKLKAHACEMLIGACDPMFELMPNHPWVKSQPLLLMPCLC